MASHPGSRRSRRRKQRRPVTRMVVAGTGAVAVIVVGAAVADAAMSNPTSYRLALVTTGSPNPALTTVGTIEPARQSTLTFPIAGRVAAVSVHQGQSVIGGQPLAALDTTSMSAQLAQTKSSVAAARARLSADQDAQSATAAATTGSNSGSGQAATTGARLSDPTTSLQKALTADQHAADAMLRQARTAVAMAATICRAAAAPLPQPSPHGPATPSSTPSATSTPRRPTTATAEPSPTPSSTPDGPATVHPGTRGTHTAPNGDLSACDAAESRALAVESTTYQDEQKVQTAVVALDRALATAAGRRTGSAVPRSSTPATGPTGTAAASGAARNAAPTAEQLAADQSAIDAATAQQQVAEQNLDQAKLVSPDAGTVQSVTFHVGDMVSAASTTEDVVISSPGGEQAVVNVPVSDIAGVIRGQHATVTPDGSATALTGTVTSIAVLPTGTDYPVAVTLDGGTTVPDGSTATVSLLSGTDRGAATVVPTSAVIARGRGYAVQVDNHGTISTVPVTVGASGPVYTEITGGLTTGQEVVIADLAAPLPTGNTGVRGFVGGGPRGPGAGTG